MLPKFSYLRALTLDEAFKALAEYGAEARILAGGTDLLVGMRGGVAWPRYLIDIKHIPELGEIRVDKDGSVAIGACVTVNDLLELELPAGCDALCKAASVLATKQVRNRATVGGNLCNASPACDLGPPLLVLGARLRLVSAAGERTIDLKDWFVCPKKTCIAEGEMLAEVVVLRGAAVASVFGKRQRIRGHDLAVVNAAAALAPGGLKVAVGAVAPKPLLLEGLGGDIDFGAAASDRVLKRVNDAISPIDDVRASGAYRRLMAEGLVRDLLEELKDRAGGGKRAAK